MAEGARLESVFSSNRDVGSNPTLSARLSNLFPYGWRIESRRVPLASPSLREVQIPLRVVTAKSV